MLTYEVPGILTVDIATLSVAVTENVIVWDCELVETTTELSLTVKLLIVGFVLSVLETDIVILDVLEFPAESVAVATIESLVFPKL